ncbi:hypothetical protein CEQ21_02685 [Niallia circulans]|uniref:Uncharacterized protein n=1 Tax=Niallia circulans TaxID=1397 RepID=A0A553SS95_NIACI|nr:hypothetical protein [Niallia circulans]TRZ39870.1 hypothetical protein CEQ21_02685 [Niallia circulans]
MTKKIVFQYDYNSQSKWATGYLKIGDNKFDFLCSYLFSNPLEDMLVSICQLLPGVVPFPRTHVTFTLLEEPEEYQWELQRVGKHEVNIKIYLKENADEKVVLVYEEICDIKKLVVAIVKHLYFNKELLLHHKINSLYEDLQHGIKYMK